VRLTAPLVVLALLLVLGGCAGRGDSDRDRGGGFYGGISGGMNRQ
jgi:hypothetical protein